MIQRIIHWLNQLIDLLNMNNILLNDEYIEVYQSYYMKPKL